MTMSQYLSASVAGKPPSEWGTSSNMSKSTHWEPAPCAAGRRPGATLVKDRTKLLCGRCRNALLRKDSRERLFVPGKRDAIDKPQ
jgi:hypothetical protein